MQAQRPPELPAAFVLKFKIVRQVILECIRAKAVLFDGRDPKVRQHGPRLAPAVGTALLYAPLA